MPWRPPPATPLKLRPRSKSRRRAQKSVSCRGGGSVGAEATPGALAELPALAGKFRLAAGQIAAAAEAAKTRARWRAGGAGRAQATQADLHASCRERSEAQISGLARKVSLNHVWEDLVLPPDCLAQLQEICDRARFRGEVLEDWGFERRLSLGRGLSVMFSGASCVGKTMAAEVMAGAQFQWASISTRSTCPASSANISARPRKNLSRLFAEAEDSNAILFFDEADALFGKRSEVQDAHDRHANVETSYLLQRIEEYEGISILATNLRRNMDDAFLRRIAFIVHFPLPEAAERSRHLGAEAPFRLQRRSNPMSISLFSRIISDWRAPVSPASWWPRLFWPAARGRRP